MIECARSTTQHFQTLIFKGFSNPTLIFRTSPPAGAPPPVPSPLVKRLIFTHLVIGWHKAALWPLIFLSGPWPGYTLRTIGSFLCPAPLPQHHLCPAGQEWLLLQCLLEGIELKFAEVVVFPLFCLPAFLSPDHSGSSDALN